MFYLDDCLEISKKLDKVNENIIKLKSRTMSPKNQTISDMPKGGGKQTNDLEKYLIKLEKLEQQKKNVQSELDDKWNFALCCLKESGITNTETIDLIKYRFYYGYSWKNCLKEMQNKYKHSKWNINKCFYTYRSVLHKSIY